MQLGVLISIIGQLIAIPAALFLVPGTCPDFMTRRLPSPRESGDSSNVGDLVPLSRTPVDQEDSVHRLASSEIAEPSSGSGSPGGRRLGQQEAAAARGSARRDLAGRTSTSTSGKSITPLDAIKSGFEDAGDGIREALEKMVQPLQDIPRRAGGVFSSMTGRGETQTETAEQSDSAMRYLAELRLAQESAERALGSPGWEEVANRGGVTVWKKYFPKDEYGYKYPCVKARGIIDGSAEEVMGMIVDSTRVLEYNRYSKGRTDIEHLGPHTKIVWNKAQPPLSSKLHDFCTLMHMEPLEDGAYMLITRATEHPEAPLLEGHVRSEILLGVTILRPAEGDTSRTEMTTVNHIISNGVPVMIADRVSTKNAIDFIQNVEIAALAAAGKESSIEPSLGQEPRSEKLNAAAA